MAYDVCSGTGACFQCTYSSDRLIQQRTSRAFRQGQPSQFRAGTKVFSFRLYQGQSHVCDLAHNQTLSAQDVCFLSMLAAAGNPSAFWSTQGTHGFARSNSQWLSDALVACTGSFGQLNMLETCCKQGIIKIRLQRKP